MSIDPEKIIGIGKVLNDTNRPMKERFRALFTLKNIGGPLAISCIKQCFSDNSALLKHELAYCLGQMQDSQAIPILEAVLRDVEQEPMVRHEAAEALGAIGSRDVVSLLEEFASDPVVTVAETCHLALGRIKWLASNSDDPSSHKQNAYFTVDPTPAASEKNLNKLKDVLLDEKADLYERYKALFALRNMHTLESALALAEGLSTGGALFRHEVAFVLGQLQEPATVDALIDGLEDKTQDEMVRHECAEALGAIATDTALVALRKHLKDAKQVVRESCEVALDMGEYENSPEFQYADTLLKV